MMRGVNYVIYGCFSAKTTPGVSLYRSLKLEENIVEDRVRNNNLKRKIKNQILRTCRSFVLT